MKYILKDHKVLFSAQTSSVALVLPTHMWTFPVSFLYRISVHTTHDEYKAYKSDLPPNSLFQQMKDQKPCLLPNTELFSDLSTSCSILTMCCKFYFLNWWWIYTFSSAWPLETYFLPGSCPLSLSLPACFHFSSSSSFLELPP